jgi:RNA polymerase sigma-70 factor, ECF subfamily
MTGPMATPDAVTEELLGRAAQGDRAARERLLEMHRPRLRHMVAVRLDRRLAPRVDPSDVVQEALVDAQQMLSDYLRQRPLPFYPWLRRLAWKRLMKLYQQHLDTKKRSAKREAYAIPLLPDESAWMLGERLVDPGTSPSNRLLRQELCQRVQAALAGLSTGDREVLVLRFVEQLSTREAAAILDITETALKSRQTRALTRLCRLLRVDKTEDEP